MRTSDPEPVFLKLLTDWIVILTSHYVDSSLPVDAESLVTYCPLFWLRRPNSDISVSFTPVNFITTMI